MKIAEMIWAALRNKGTMLGTKLANKVTKLEKFLDWQQKNKNITGINTMNKYSNVTIQSINQVPCFVA